MPNTVMVFRGFSLIRTFKVASLYTGEKAKLSIFKMYCR